MIFGVETHKYIEGSQEQQEGVYMFCYTEEGAQNFAAEYPDQYNLFFAELTTDNV